MPTTLTRPNRYPAHCIRCHARIPAGQGLLARADDGSWAADHDGPCPEKPVVAATPRHLVDHDGIYRTDDGTIYKVQHAKTGSGRLYAKRLHLTPHPDGTTSGTFHYAAGTIHTLRDDQRLTATEAAAFGALYGVCVACGRDLTDENSIAAGIGPICARKYF